MNLFLLYFLESVCEASTESEIEHGSSDNRPKEPRPTKTRSWTPLSLYNADYVTLLKERKGMSLGHDFIKENIVSQVCVCPSLQPRWSYETPKKTNYKKKKEKNFILFCSNFKRF